MAEIKSEEELLKAIDDLTAERARFIIKALMIAGHVGSYKVVKAMDLAETITA